MVFENINAFSILILCCFNIFKKLQNLVGFTKTSNVP